MADTLNLGNLKEDLGGKPVWFWGLLGGVFVLALYYVFKSKKAATIAGTMANGQGSVTDTLNAAYPTVDSSLAGGVQSNPGVTNSLGDTTLETKESWTGRAVVIGQRIGSSGIFITNALNKYFAGKPITKTEAAQINKIIAEIGLPPGGQNKAVTIIKTAAGATPTNTSVNDTKVKTPLKTPAAIVTLPTTRKGTVIA